MLRPPEAQVLVKTRYSRFPVALHSSLRVADGTVRNERLSGRSAVQAICRFVGSVCGRTVTGDIRVMLGIL